MFNVGIFGKSKPANVVYLTSRTMPLNYYDDYNSRWNETLYSLGPNGQANGGTTYNVGDYPNQWLTPITAGVGAGYEVRFTRLTGLSYGNVYLSGGSFGSWLSMSSSKTLYTMAPITIEGDPEETIRVEIRAVGNATILATADITFQ